jgi:hypothetical protein
MRATNLRIWNQAQIHLMRAVGLAPDPDRVIAFAQWFYEEFDRLQRFPSPRDALRAQDHFAPRHSPTSPSPSAPAAATPSCDDGDGTCGSAEIRGASASRPNTPNRDKIRDIGSGMPSLPAMVRGALQAGFADGKGTCAGNRRNP